MIIPYIVGMDIELNSKAETFEKLPAEDQIGHTVIESNRNVLMSGEDNSFELSYLQFREKIEKERRERESLARNK